MQPQKSDLDHLAWLKFAGVLSFSNKSIIDLGCGSGYICHYAITQGATQAIGVDILSPPQQLGTTRNWRFKSYDLNHQTWHQALPSHSFDIITAFDIIEHLDAPYLFLRSCQAILKPQGLLILTTPNINSWERFLHPTSWSGCRDQQHKTLFNKYSLAFILERSGFQVLRQKSPVRAFSFLGILQPQMGGQIFCLAQN